MEAGLSLPSLGSLHIPEGLSTSGAFFPPLSNPADVSARLSSFIMGRQALSHHVASATS